MNLILTLKCEYNSFFMFTTRVHHRNDKTGVPPQRWWEERSGWWSSVVMRGSAFTLTVDCGGGEGVGQGGWEWAYLPQCTLQSVWKGRGEGGGSVRCWIAYLRSQSPPFARALSPLRGPAMDVTPGYAFFIILLHFQHADTLYIANSIGTWRGFYCQYWSRLGYFMQEIRICSDVQLYEAATPVSATYTFIKMNEV